MSLALPCLRRGKVVRAASAGRVQPIGGRVFAFVGGFGARTWIMTPPAVCLPFLPWIGLCFYIYFVFGCTVAVCETGRWINGFLYIGRSADIHSRNISNPFGILSPVLLVHSRVLRHSTPFLC